MNAIVDWCPYENIVCRNIELIDISCQLQYIPCWLYMKYRSKSSPFIALGKHYHHCTKTFLVSYLYTCESVLMSSLSQTKSEHVFWTDNPIWDWLECLHNMHGLNLYMQGLYNRYGSLTIKPTGIIRRWLLRCMADNLLWKQISIKWWFINNF